MTKTGYSFKILFGCLLLAGLMRLPGLNLSLDRDEGEYATLGQQWNRGEALPYRDLMEIKPPLVPFLNRICFALGGENVRSIRVMALLWQLAGVAALYFLMALSAGRMEALLATVLFVVASCGARVQGFSANTENFVTLPLVLGMLALVRRSKAPSWFLFGLGAGLAGLAKQSALPALFVFPLLLSRGPREACRALGLSLSGAALPWAATGGYFILQGAGKDLFFCLFQYGFIYAVQGWVNFMGNALAALRALAMEQAGLWAAALAGLMLGGLPVSSQRRLHLAWLASALLGVCASGRFFPHYFQVLAAPLACLAALGAKALWESSRGWGAKKILALGCLGLFASGWYFTTSGLYLAKDGGEQSYRLYGLKVFGDAPAAAQIINQADPGGKFLWIWGNETELFFLTGRRPASRFIYIYPFNGEAPAWPRGEEELLKALQNPEVKVVAMPFISALDPRQPLQAVLADELNRRFQAAGQSEQFLVGARRP
jgi:4-amino-4-deoxy-L-arabinose transferase-like glycosyltransferase